MEEIRTKLRTFLGRYIRRQFEDGDHLFERGLVNSLFAMQLVTHLENTYGIEVTNDDLEIDNFKSVDAICGFVALKQGAVRKLG